MFKSALFRNMQSNGRRSTTTATLKQQSDGKQLVECIRIELHDLFANNSNNVSIAFVLTLAASSLNHLSWTMHQQNRRMAIGNESVPMEWQQCVIIIIDYGEREGENMIEFIFEFKFGFVWIGSIASQRTMCM